jgi:hypothetical protein
MKPVFLPVFHIFKASFHAFKLKRAFGGGCGKALKWGGFAALRKNPFSEP